MNDRKLTFLLILSCLSQILFAQYEISIEAFVFNKETEQPVPYVNIGFKGKTIKTVTDKNGKFTLTYDEDSVKQTDVLKFSAFGYRTQETNAGRLYKLLKNTNRIYLVPETLVTVGESSSSDPSKNNLAEGQNIVKGKVTSKNVPLQGAIVKIKNTLVETQTNFDGEYGIAAKEGDILVFDFLGMVSKEITVGINKSIDVELESDATVLDEVVLFGEREKEEMIDLGLDGKKSFDAIGTSVNVITSKDIGSQYYDLWDLLNGKFAALNHSREGSMNNNQGIILDIDGMLFVGKDIPAVDPQNIETLTILTSLASTNKYGSMGRGGVIVIRTKTFSGTMAESNKPSALATGNDYTESLEPYEASTAVPQYLLALQSATTFDEAKAVYATLKQVKGNLTVPFYIDAAGYFLKWDKTYALGILTHVEGLCKDNAKALKTLAFNYEALDKLEEARLVYQRIAILRPNDAQSYRDLALIYEATGYYNEAMRLYKQMLGNSIEGVDFSGLQQPIVDELMHLLAFQRSEVDHSDLPSDFLTVGFKQDIRIVFEWNDPSAEFELQFVNPKKKFFKWPHTKLDNQGRMLDEIKKGYTTMSNIIDDDEAGEWTINIETFNEEPTANPNYIKYTIYKNYGLPNETKTIKLLQLERIEKKVTLDKLVYQ